MTNNTIFCDTCDITLQKNSLKIHNLSLKHKKCEENKKGYNCDLWRPDSKTCIAYMELAQASKAYEIVQDDQLFATDKENTKSIFILSIEHTVMNNHNTEMQNIPVNLQEVTDTNIGEVIQYIVHAADLIGQSLPRELSKFLGKLIDREIAEGKKNEDAAFKASQINFFIIPFKYIEFWVRLIRCYTIIIKRIYLKN